MRQYFYIGRDEEQRGPFSLEQLSRESITRKTMIWHEGMKDWKPAHTIPELVSLLDGIPPAPSKTKKPDSWLAWSIISAILCCLPLSIPAIVYAAKVDSLWYSNQIEESERAAKKARNWTIASAVSAVVLWILYMFFILVLGFASII